MPRLACQPEGRHSVDQTEIDGLGESDAGPHVTCSRARSNTSAAVAWCMSPICRERPQQPVVCRKVRHDAQLDLRIIGRHQHCPGGATNAWRMRRPSGAADRNVLQVGVGGGQPAGRRHGLVIGSVHAPGTAVDLFGKLVGVGGLAASPGAR